MGRWDPIEFHNRNCIETMLIHRQAAHPVSFLSRSTQLDWSVNFCLNFIAAPTNARVPLLKPRFIALSRDAWYQLRSPIRGFAKRTARFLHSWQRRGWFHLESRRSSNQSTLVVKLFLPLDGTIPQAKRKGKEKVCLRRVYVRGWFRSSRETAGRSQAYKCPCRLGCHNS